MIATCRTAALIALSTALGIACCSCDPGKSGADANVKFAPVSEGKPGDPATDMPDVPKDAQFTIFCRAFQEETHVQDSRQAQEMLFTSTNMKKWYVVHSGDHSTLYYGFYRTMDPHDPTDGAEGQRAITDQNNIRAMATSEGQRLFSECLIVGIDAPDPEANPAWDVMRTKGFWSIEIASFTGTADRKQRAVQAVSEARKDGLEMYYYHGTTASSVCYGCWPAEAADEVTVDIQNTDPDKPLFITPKPLTSSISGPLARNGIQSVAPHVDIQDPTLTQALNKFPEHSTNGQSHAIIDPVTGQQKIVEKPFLFKIPHKDPLDDSADDHYRAAPTTPLAPPPTPQQNPDLGHLRSLGD